MTPARGAVGGGLGTLVLVVLFLLMGGDPMTLLSMVDVGPQVSQQSSRQITPEEEELAEFVSVVLAETEDVWRVLLPSQGVQYREPTLVLFSGYAQSACGYASSAVGPFYCPADEKVYIDLSFYDELRRKFQAPGDFAQAYVIAHEVGHHIQKILGISDQVNSARNRVGKTEYNELSVRLELQADFLAGVWAHHAQRTAGILEPGDIEEAIGAASAIGDDRLQEQAQGYVVPDSFTHGTSEQRVRWFMKGYKSGDISQGDTFEAETL
jgi:predicted metalloprotease